MITRKDNFVTLQDSNGKQLNPMDPGYIDFLLTLGKQQDAVQVNLAAKVDYFTKLDAYQQSVDAGRGEGLVAPAKPKVQLVDDSGTVSYVDFNPPLPDPKPVAVITPNSGGFGGLGAGSSGGVSNGDIGKKLDALLQLISLLISKISSK